MANPPPRASPALHVLVVEDDTLVGDTILAMLEGEVDATLVNDTASACGVLDSGGKVDVILLDCLLPGGGIARVLARADECRVPVILTSGAAEEIARFGGTRPALSKPFLAEDLLVLLRKAAAGRA